MITFCVSIVLLIAGYFLYGKLVEKIFGANAKNSTPATTMADGVDYIPMKPWRIFLIQFLNIAGLGPIFGAIMGAKFGSASFLWIVFGSIFAGAVHDYIAGMISIRNNGCSLPEIHGKYLGNGVKQLMRGFMIILMILIGVVFVTGPANLLASLTPDYLNAMFWIVVIIVYYIIATLFPIDKIIGKVYPIFGACLLFMAIGIMIALFVNSPDLPEIWDGLSNKMPNPDATPIFPMMFVSIACGAISGFHATQSPLMARCMTNEKYGRPIFYGSMIAEGIVALIWAMAATYFFFDPSNPGKDVDLSGGAAVVVNFMTRHWLGTAGAILAILGVVFAPITSGDTAFRSARLIIADFMHIDQKPAAKRLLIAIPLFVVATGVLIYVLLDPQGFDVIWRYFAWTNQVLATFTLWAITIYLVTEKKCYWITLIPAIFMTLVCSTFILIAKKEGFGLSPAISYSLSSAITLACTIAFFVWKNRHSKTNLFKQKQ